MNSLLLVLLILLLCFAVFVYSQSGKKTSTRGEFELQIGNEVFEVVIGKTFTVTTPKGEKLDLTLRRKETLFYSGKQISFDYPSEMELSSDTEKGVKTIYLESTASPFVMLQIYPPGNSEAIVLSSLMDAFTHEFNSRNAEFLPRSGNETKRFLQTVERNGKALKYILSGQKMITEIYTFKKQKSVIALILQHDTVETKLAENYFSIVTNSINYIEM